MSETLLVFFFRAGGGPPQPTLSPHVKLCAASLRATAACWGHQTMSPGIWSLEALAAAS